jgi:hypothetical protein
MINNIVVFSILMASTDALASDRVCRGRIGAVDVDNVVVPDGATCRLVGTRVGGTVEVGTGSTLIATGVDVDGNVQAEGSASVWVRGGSFVGGSVQIVQGLEALIADTVVGGDILFDDQSSRVGAVRNDVGGNIQAFQNTGGVLLRDNFVDGNLQCTGNQPAPVGGGNDVQGSKENQCAAL